MQPMIKISDGVPRLPQWRLAKPVNFCLDKGENIAVVGNNGSGKSLLVDIVTGKHPLQEGRIEYDFSPSTKQYAYENIKSICFKDTYGGDNDSSYYLQQRWNQTEINPDTATVGSYLAKYSKASSDDTHWGEDLKERVCKLFGIDEMLDKYVILLSSGELRKLMIASAVLSQPRLLIIDNPYIGLDKEARTLLTNLLETLSREQSLQIMLIVNRATDIPKFITHVVETKDMAVGEKMSRQEYLSRHTEEQTLRAWTSDMEAKIAALPYNSNVYNAQHVVEMNDVCIRYNERTILKNLSWTVLNGEHWVLTGRNGSGKSTLLSLVCADNPQSYACDIALFDRQRGSGESIWDIKRHIGYVSPEMHRAFKARATVLRVVESGFSNGAGIYAKSCPEKRDVCLFWLSIFRIEDLAGRIFQELSSGEQRLVLLARAMVKDPELLILDEPFHGLDDSNRLRVMAIIEAFCRRRDKTLIMVTHYEDEIPQCIDHKKVLTRNK